MDKSLIQILIADVAIPELLRLLRGLTITEDQMLIVLNQNVEQVKAVGQAFLDQTRPPNP